MSSSHESRSPRLLPDVPLPSYAFVPGLFPHPESDPSGHSYGIPRPVATFDPALWPTCREYLRGLDLFNAGYLWESHVEFESLWQACGRKGRYADFFKSLIHLAAAGVKHHEGKPAGVRWHAQRAGVLLRRLVEAPDHVGDVWLGLSLSELIEVAGRIAHQGWQEGLVLVPQFPDEASARRSIASPAPGSREL